MESKIKALLYKQIEFLEDHQQTLFDKGHTFWFCDSQDIDHNKPFYYYQINRTQNMATCSTCYKLIELRKEIRAIQKLLKIELTPLITNFKNENLVKNISVNNKSDFNPNYSYMS